MTAAVTSTVRNRILDAAVELLETGGMNAVSTRAVEKSAGVRAPAIYRLFGDKDGLLAAAAERIQSDWVAEKGARISPADPIEALREGWDDAVQFGLDHPGAYRVTRLRGKPGPAYILGYAMLTEKMRRAADAGLLLETPERAALLFHAAGRGVIATLIDLDIEERDMQVSTLAREAILRTIVTALPADVTLASSASALRSLVPKTTLLAPQELQLLNLWLDRLSSEPA